MGRESRETWAKRVERWKDSGLTAREYAAELGIKSHSLNERGSGEEPSRPSGAGWEPRPPTDVDGGPDGGPVLRAAGSLAALNLLAALTWFGFSVAGSPFERFGLWFEEPIGVRIAPDGSRIPLHYGEAKVSQDGLYHVIPRTGPAE